MPSHMRWVPCMYRSHPRWEGHYNNRCVKKFLFGAFQPLTLKVLPLHMLHKTSNLHWPIRIELLSLSGLGIRTLEEKVVVSFPCIVAQAAQLTGFLHFYPPADRTVLSAQPLLHFYPHHEGPSGNYSPTPDHCISALNWVVMSNCIPCRINIEHPLARGSHWTKSSFVISGCRLGGQWDVILMVSWLPYFLAWAISIVQANCPQAFNKGLPDNCPTIGKCPYHYQSFLILHEASAGISICHIHCPLIMYEPIWPIRCLSTFKHRVHKCRTVVTLFRSLSGCLTWWN